MTRRALPRLEPTFSRPQNAGLTYVSSTDPAALNIFGVPPSPTGRPVTEISAMRVSACYACVRLIAGTIASLPVDIYKRGAGNARTKVNESDNLWWVLNEEPHARWSASNFWKRIVWAELLRGDGLAEIIRGRGGVPVGLKPIWRGSAQIVLKDDRLSYFFSDETGQMRGLDQDDVLHVPGFGFDGIRGMSAIAWGAHSGIGIGLPTDEFAGRFFGSGAQIKHALRSPGKMLQPQIDALRAQWEERYSGLDNAFKPLVLTEGLDVKELSLSAADAQLLEARKFQVIDIARAFGIPPILIGDNEKTSSWGAGVEQIVLAFLKFTLAERLVTIEQELNRKLFRTAGRFVKFDSDALLRGDSASRAAFLRQLVGGSAGPGMVTQNEARAMEDFPPHPDGNTLYSPAGQAQGTPANA